MKYKFIQDSIDHEFAGIPYYHVSSYKKVKKLTHNEYKKEWAEWHKKREQKLSSDYGWLSLRSIDWLVENETIKIEGFPGKWKQEGNSVTYIPESGKSVRNRGKIIETSKTLTVSTVGDVNVEDFEYHGVKAQLIKRISGSNRKFAVRQRDPNSNNIHDFKGISNFEISKDWVVPAKYIPLRKRKEIKTNAVVSDLIHNETAIGYLVFTYKLKEYKLIVFQGHNDDSGWIKIDPQTNKTIYLNNRQETENSGFVLFKDTTTGKQTYGGGRIIILDIENPKKIDYLDFNTTCNLPCFFSEFCTCPVAPKENFLPFGVYAGEKN